MNAVNPVHSPGVPNAAEPSMEEILASIRRIIADDTSLRPGDAADQGHAATRHDEVAAMPGEARAAVAEPLPHLLHAAEPEPLEPEPLEPEPPRHESKESAIADATYEAPVADALPGGHANVGALQFSSPEGPMAEPITELPRHPLAPPEVVAHGSVELEPEPAAPGPQPRDVADTGVAPAIDLPQPEPLFSAVTDSSVTSAFNMLAASRFVDNSEQLAGLVRDMIRPMVKAWVDEHLPGMVERLVVAEIERMARR